jgi:hypothetical protein
MDWLTAIVEVVRSIAWPIAAFAIVFFFRIELRSVAQRVIKLTPTGLELAPPPESQIPTPPDAASLKLGTTANAGSSSTSESIPSISETIARLKLETPADQLTEVTNRIRGDLDRLIDASCEQKLEAMLLAFANMKIVLGHERNYRVIFGSQIELIARVNISSPLGLPKESAEAIYNNAANNFPDFYKTMTFDKWIHFPVAAGLLFVSDGRYAITPYGAGFLKYIIDQKLEFAKAF